ncbi:MAG: hypothetical protein KAI66_11380 [Lentisphaeria bacterium]|nr:hypothetical protein [Lentisphaeria bacterium]
MTYEQFNTIITNRQHSIVLVEGTRSLPAEDVDTLAAFGKWLAETYPQAMFRTGNADGADTAFARGIIEVDPSRLEYVLPYGGHRKESIAQSSCQIALTDMPRVAEERAVYHTSQASPQYQSLMKKRETMPRLRAKARYILRDTIKVIGAEESSLSPATAGIFYVNPDDPMKGGTGHTIRVCQEHNVPIAFQDEWMKWSTKQNLCTL